MIEALATLGQYSIAQREGTDESHLQTLVDDPKTSTRYKHVLFVTFDAAKDYSFTGVEYEEYQKRKFASISTRKVLPTGRMSRRRQGLPQKSKKPLIIRSRNGLKTHWMTISCGRIKQITHSCSSSPML